MSVITASNLRAGQFVQYTGELHQVLYTEFVRQGRGGSSVALTLMNPGSGRTVNLRCGADEKFTTADVELAEVEYLYDDGERIHCADGADYDSSLLDTDIVPLLGPSTQLSVLYVDGEARKISLARNAVVVIADTEPYLPLQTAASAFKSARLANGWLVEVPAFIETGDFIILDTQARSYLAKAE